jgi:hypothetical protein
MENNKELNDKKQCDIHVVRSCTTCFYNVGKGKVAMCCHCSGNLDMYEPKK